MKNPLSFLTYSSISLLSALVAQYLTDDGALLLFRELFGRSQGFAAKTAFFGFCCLAALFFGVFVCLLTSGNGFVTAYFFGFSRVIHIAAFYLVFSAGIFWAGLLWTLVLLLVIFVLSASNRGGFKISLFALPELLCVLFLFALCFLKLLAK